MTEETEIGEIIDTTIILDPDLSDSAFRTLLIYLHYAQLGYWPGIERIAKERNRSVAVIKQHDKELQQLGYITKIDKPIPQIIPPGALWIQETS